MEKVKSNYANLLNRLLGMQDAPYYATAKETLVLAEVAITSLEERLNAAEGKLERVERKVQFADNLHEQMIRGGWRAPSDTNIMSMMGDAGYYIPEEEYDGDDDDE